MVDKVEKSKPGDDGAQTETSQSTADTSTISGSTEGQKNRAIYDQTQQVHKIGDSASNLLIPKHETDQVNTNAKTSDTEAAKGRQLGIVDEQRGIVHTGAGVLPHLPENITASYGENLKAIKPTKSEMELQDKVAQATLSWMRGKV